MKKTDIFAIAFGNFRRRKLRSVLTVLGVVIGTASIVVMISLGIAVNQSFEQQIETIGDLTTINVSATYGANGKVVNPLDDAAVLSFEGIDDVDAVSPEISISGKLLAGKYVGYASIIGVRTDMLKKLGFEAEQGQLLNTESAGNKTILCMFGSDVALNFYDPKASGGGGGGIVMKEGYVGGDEIISEPVALFDPMDEKIRLRFTFDYSYGEKTTTPTDPAAAPATLYTFKNMGVLKPVLGERDYTVYIDLETAKSLKKDQMKYEGQKLTTKLNYDQIKVMTNSISKTLEITKVIKEMGYEAWSNAEWIQSMQEQSRMLQLLLGGIGSVSLFVAAIGITNTMIMSIYERTHDIGVMKVIGCVLKDIRDMFLCEAAIIGLFGGVIGLGLSFGISILLNFIGQSGVSGISAEGMNLSVIPAWLALASVIFAIFVGVAAGFFPARRAMRLSALEAMRN